MFALSFRSLGRGLMHEAHRLGHLLEAGHRRPSSLHFIACPRFERLTDCKTPSPLSISRPLLAPPEARVGCVVSLPSRTFCATSPKGRKNCGVAPATVRENARRPAWRSRCTEAAHVR